MSLVWRSEDTLLKINNFGSVLGPGGLFLYEISEVGLDEVTIRVIRRKINSVKVFFDEEIRSVWSNDIQFLNRCLS